MTKFAFLISFLFICLTSYCQIKFNAFEVYEDSHRFFEDDTIKCNVTIIDNNWNNEIKIIDNNKETIYSYEGAEINRPLFMEDNEKAKNKIKYEFVVDYINVTDKNSTKHCILIYKLKNKSTYLIKIQRSLHRYVIYKAELIQGEFPK